MRPTVQDRPGASAAWVRAAVARGRLLANLQTASHSVIEKLLENARQAAALRDFNILVGASVGSAYPADLHD